MGSYYLLYYLHQLMGTCLSIIFTVLNFKMVGLARQKRLSQFLPWLRSAAVATLITAIIYVGTDLSLLLGFRRSMTVAALTLIMAMVALVPTAISIFRLWQMIVDMPPMHDDNIVMDNDAEDVPEEWPPRPKKPK